MTEKSRFFVEKIILKYESSIGLLEFRFIDINDIEFLQNLLKQNLSDKEFSIKVLYNQLENVIPYNNFLDINDNELNIITQEFAKKVDYIYNYYSKIKSDSIFYKFKKSIELYLEEWQQRLLKLSKVITERFELTRKVIENSIKIPKLISMVALPKIVFPKIVIPDILNHIKIFNSSFLRLIQEQSKAWQNFAVQFKKISKKSLNNLKKYNWFINKSMPASFMAETAKVNNAKEMKNLFISYHIYNNCEVLDNYLIEWKKNPLFKRRIKILSDAISLFKDQYKEKKINVNNIVVPLLINQIEGLRHDYLKNKGIIHLGKNSWQDPNTRRTVKWTDFYTDTLKNEDDFTKLTFKVFSDILFQQENQKAPITNFSRHKISHGLNTKYGTLETTTRCFMILEFISDLK